MRRPAPTLSLRSSRMHGRGSSSPARSRSIRWSSLSKTPEELDFCAPCLICRVSSRGLEMVETDLPQADPVRPEPAQAYTCLSAMHPADMPETDIVEESGEGDLVVNAVSKRFRTGR